MDRSAPPRLGVFYVAVGDNARYEARLSLESLQRFHSDWPVCIVTDRSITTPRGVRNLAAHPHLEDDGARSVKLKLFDLAPPEWEYIVYLDADTRVHQSLDTALCILQDGWDIVMSFSSQQGEDLLWHVPEPERLTTLDELEYHPLQLQAGVMFLRRSGRAPELFAAWYTEWQRWKGQDQAALLRALQEVPVSIYLLGRPWNGGAVVAHHYGRARRG